MRPNGPKPGPSLLRPTGSYVSSAGPSAESHGFSNDSEPGDAGDSGGTASLPNGAQGDSGAAGPAIASDSSGTAWGGNSAEPGGTAPCGDSVGTEAGGCAAGLPTARFGENLDQDELDGRVPANRIEEKI